MNDRFTDPSDKLTMNPHLWGPLIDEPLLETGGAQFFQGEEKFLSRSKLRRKRKMLASVSGVLRNVLAEDETIVYATTALQQPRVTEFLGMGWWFTHLHRVVLVLTDRRLVEILMNGRGGKPATRIRSWAWGGARSLKRGMGSLTLRMNTGTKYNWSIPDRADRKLLKKLVPNVGKRIEEVTGSTPAFHTHHWHCPSCGARVVVDPVHCPGCGERFRTWKTAAILSLSFPGAGLLYARRPVLGTLDLLGEMFLYVGFLLMLLASSGRPETVLIAGIGAVFLVLTKLESVHLSHILVRRAIPITQGARSGWRKLAYGGGAVSVAAIGLALVGAGSLYRSVERDLDFRSVDGWHGTLDAGQLSLAEDGVQRSEWSHESGLQVAVFAHLLEPETTWEDFRDEYVMALKQQGLRPEVLDEGVPGDFEGFRSVLVYDDPDGTRWLELNYMVWDEASPAVHQVLSYVPAPAYDEALEGMDVFLSRANWIPAVDR